MRILLTWILYVLCSLVIVTMFAVQSRWIYLRYTPPIKYLSSIVETPIIKNGSILQIRYRFDRARYCETTLSLFIIELNTQSIVWRDRVPGGGGGRGRDALELRRLHRRSDGDGRTRADRAARRRGFGSHGRRRGDHEHRLGPHRQALGRPPFGKLDGRCRASWRRRGAT